MKMTLLNTVQGLKPCYDEDYDEKKKLKIGEIYTATIYKQRNLKFHRKFFALIRTAWAFQNEKRREVFKNSVDIFRASILLNSGICERIWLAEKKQYVDIPRSLAFDSMEEKDFEECYSKCLDFILKRLVNHISEDEFKRNIEDFLK